MSGARWGLYIHVPWCRARCPYCGFYVVPGSGPWAPFVARLRAEHDERRAAFGGPAATVFLGGGTPSRLPPEALARLLGGLDRQPGAEVSAEANPEDIDDRWLEGAVGAGVTRLSVGVQTFSERLGRRLGRAHTVKQAVSACRLLPGSGLASWSVDLIFAVPGQTVADLDADLDVALDLGAPHVSVYGLTIEPGTRFERARQRGTLPDVDDETWRRLYDRLLERLEAAGFERYEVSNLARPGHCSAHNLLYWSDAPYLGLGPSAHSYLPDGRRASNVADLEAWLRGAPPEVEVPSPEEAATDLLVSGLRGVDGVPIAHLAARTGLVPAPDVIRGLVRAGLLRDRDDRLALTRAGFPVCDALVARLSGALTAAR